MDDDRLAQLLHDAVQESPPATFDADDVLTESRRLTARRRSLVRNTTVGAVVLVAAGITHRTRRGGPRLVRAHCQ